MFTETPGPGTMVAVFVTRNGETCALFFTPGTDGAIIVRAYGGRNMEVIMHSHRPDAEAEYGEMIEAADMRGMIAEQWTADRAFI